MTPRTAGRMLVVLGVGATLLVGCSDDAKETVGDATGSVAAKQRALDTATAAFESASEGFCTSAHDYVVAVDRYGDVLVDTAVTVGDVTTAGADLSSPRKEVQQGIDAVTAAQAEVVEAQQELDAAKAEESGTTSASPRSTTTTEPLVEPVTAQRVEQAEADLEAARKGVTDQTSLAEAGQQFNAAAVSLEVAWMRVLVDAGCLDDQQVADALSAVQDYTTSLQTSLQGAGHYDGKVDGVYGPATVEGVESLQSDAGLPVTGYVDKATAAALTAAVAAKGGAIVTQSTADTAAVQTLLTLAGYWDGPIDGQWTDDLTDAVKELQAGLGVAQTGAIDAITLQAVEDHLAKATAPGSTTTSGTAASDVTTTTS